VNDRLNVLENKRLEFPSDLSHELGFARQQRTRRFVAKQAL